MLICSAEEKDLDSIMAIYEEKFKASGMCPEKELVEQEIRSHTCYVVKEEDRIVAAFLFKFGKDVEESYHTIYDGEWLSDKPYGAIRHVAASGDIDEIEEQCINWAFWKCGHLRMDTNLDNFRMHAVLKANGFKQCGIIRTVEKNKERLAFEK